DAERVGDHLRRLALPRLREVVEPAVGDVEDDTRPRSLRKTEPGRDDDPAVLRRQPHRHAGVRADDFLVADVVAPRDIEQRAAADVGDEANAADDRAAVARQRERGGVQRRNSARRYGDERRRRRVPERHGRYLRCTFLNARSSFSSTSERPVCTFVAFCEASFAALSDLSAVAPATLASESACVALACALLAVACAASALCCAFAVAAPRRSTCC